MHNLSPVYILSGCLFLIALTIFGSAPHTPALGEWLFKWQTLVGSVLALLGAYWTVRKISEQIEQADTQHKDEILRRRNAARVALPLALAEVSDFIEKIADNVATELEAYSPTSEREPREVLVRRGDGFTPLPEVDLPKEVISAFQGFVETLDSESEVRHVAELLSSIQILKARYSSFNFSEVMIESSLYSLLLDAAKIGFLNDCLYNFGRFLDNQSFAVVREIDDAVAWDKIRRRAHNLIFARPLIGLFVDGIDRPIDGYKQRGETPWLEKFEID